MAIPLSLSPSVRLSVGTLMIPHNNREHKYSRTNLKIL